MDETGGLIGLIMDMNASEASCALARAQVLASAGRNDDCACECAAALEQFERTPSPRRVQTSEAARLYCLLGWADEARGNLAGARRAFRRAVRLSPARGEAWEALARICQALFRETGEWVLAEEGAAARRNVKFIHSAGQFGSPGGRPTGADF